MGLETDGAPGPQPSAANMMQMVNKFFGSLLQQPGNLNFISRFGTKNWPLKHRLGQTSASLTTTVRTAERLKDLKSDRICTCTATSVTSSRQDNGPTLSTLGTKRSRISTRPLYRHSSKSCINSSSYKRHYHYHALLQYNSRDLGRPLHATGMGTDWANRMRQNVLPN